MAGHGCELLEEPSAVAWGQAAFAEYGRGAPLDSSDSWYSRPVIDVLGHLLWPTVDALYPTEATITDGLVEVAARRCASLLDTADGIERAGPPSSPRP